MHGIIHFAGTELARLSACAPLTCARDDRACTITYRARGNDQQGIMKKGLIIRAEGGTTLLELLVTFCISGLLLSIGVSNMLILSDSLEDSAAQFSGFLKRTRAKAMSTTSAYLVQPTSYTTSITSYGISCDDTSGFVTDDRLRQELAEEVQFVDPSWSICFSPRGLTTTSPTIYLRGSDARLRSVQVYLGGAIRLS